MINYVLFDFDGTLIDSNDAVISSLNHVSMTYRGRPYDHAELQSVLGKPIYDQVCLLSEGNLDALVEAYRTEYRRVMDEKTTIYEGVLALLKGLKEKGMKIGIVSNKGRNGIKHGIERFELQPYIDVSISLDDVKVGKPDPEGIYTALSALGVTGDAMSDALKQTVFVGDSAHDLESANRAGCRSILVAWTLLEMTTLMAHNPTYVAETPGDILDFIVR